MVSMPRCNPLFLVYFVCAGAALSGQPSRVHVPAPLSIRAPLVAAWKAMHEVLDLNRHEVAEEEFSKGSILTRSREYSSGPLAASHIRKIAEPSKLVDGEWVKAEYQYQIHIQYVSEKETLAWVDARIRGLKRPFIGTDAWVKLNSTGKLEEELLTLFGQHLFGQTFSLDQPKPGFWERKPGHVREAFEAPRAVGPERTPGL